MRNRYFIFLAYNGKNYCGWQNQPNGITVQGTLEQALSTLLRSAVSVTGAGRTDTGVHARVMAAHFNREEDGLDTADLTVRLNRLLPPEIAVYSIVKVHPDAHARFDAISRTYKYYLTSEKNPFYYDRVYRVYHDLDFVRMNEAAAVLPEYTDFTSFSRSHTDVKTNNCRIIGANWEKEDGHWVFTIEADRFLRNMVRAIVGTLLDVGRGKRSPEDFREIIEAKDRRKAGSSAPAYALFLHDIKYPERIFLAFGATRISWSTSG
ncbi:MAG: tRNA pseudouridine(38-40) synthase TruA [Candidatus Symbiothrix sp.]|jgi:tRNA pseudouridine38-40 synthase|nr:tRNA pseudouridine(38-40) synthase TruA [Candidatus Symbiothrix sp.]